jgi:DHA1 family tetracycline resistance protein-like MFS transporter
MSPKINSNRFPFFILLLTIFLDWVSIGLVYPMFSSMIFHEGSHFFPPETTSIVRGTWLGILLASGPLAQFLSSPIVGALSDQKGRKPLLKNALLVMVGGYFLCAIGVFAKSLVLVLIGRSIVGIGAGNSAVVMAAIADLSPQEKKAKNFGLASMASGMGFTLGPFLGGTLSQFGFATPFLFAMVFSTINVLLVIYWFSETHHVRKTVQWSLMLGIRNLKKAFQVPVLRTLFLSFFFFCVAWSFYWEFIPVTWIQEYRLSPSQVGNFYAYGAAFYALSSGLLIRPIVSRFQPRPVFFVALVLGGLMIFPLLFHTDVNVFWIYIPIQQFLAALVFPTGTTIASNSVDEDSQGEVMGIIQSVDAFAFASSPLFAGVFVGFSTHTPIIISGSFMFLAALVLLRSYGSKIFKS